MINAYWTNGVAYCVDCVEIDPPALDEAERAKAIREPGVGICGCCKRPFAADGKCIHAQAFYGPDRQS